MLSRKFKMFFDADPTEFENLTDAEIYDDFKGVFTLKSKKLPALLAADKWAEEDIEVYIDWLDEAYEFLIFEKPSKESKVRLIRELYASYYSGVWIGSIQLNIKSKCDQKDLLEFFDLKNTDPTEYDFQHQAENIYQLYSRLKTTIQHKKIKACNLKRKYKAAIVNALQDNIFEGRFEFESCVLTWSWNPELYIFTGENQTEGRSIDWAYLDDESKKYIIYQSINYPFIWGSFLTAAKDGEDYE